MSRDTEFPYCNHKNYSDQLDQSIIRGNNGRDFTIVKGKLCFIDGTKKISECCPSGLGRKNDWSPLISAINSDNEEVVNLLLEDRVDANYRKRESRIGASALHIAIARGNRRIVEALLKHKADPNAVDSRGRSALFYATCSKNIYTYSDVLRLLLEHGASLKEPKTAYPAFANVLSYGDAEALRLFVQHGFDLAFLRRDADSALILYRAACNADKPMLGYLLAQSRLDVEVRTSERLTAFHLAVEKNNVHAAENLLENGADVNARDPQGETAVHLAVAYGNSRMLDFLLNHGADVDVRMPTGRSVLNAAFKKSNPCIMKQIVRHVAKLEAMGRTISSVSFALIRSDRLVLDFYERCKIEIKRMKTTYEYCDEEIGRVSFYELFVSDDVSAFVKNQDFLSRVEKFCTEQNFPLYCDLIAQRLFKLDINDNCLRQQFA